MPQLVWLVTGCTSGLGEELVYAILARGDRVIATGRNAVIRLSHLKDSGAAVLDIDVTASQAVLNIKIEEALAVYGRIDVLVPNAGYSEIGFVEELRQEKWQDQLQTNFFGVTNITRAILPHFRKRKVGHIAIISSVLAWSGALAAGPYAVSKHAIDGYGKTLQQEVAQFGIRTVIFNIGYIRTKLTSTPKVSVPEDDEYRSIFERFLEASATIPGNEPGDPKKCAERIVDVMKGEGMASGKPMPSQVPLGSDVLATVKETCEAMLKTCEEWKDLIKSTDFEGPKQGFWAENTVRTSW
ncbi:hypothetical protein BP5796_09657 [Coleophoma crateriformis]|uniref:NAD(P)-binding protein n=1 Tax=Coleophoma crateriformis TaxID=565419 RepID=A0A3D8QZ00_9HELO|nr:hypothetical protein BP5796_09657 [Coleophoma crateriformis]